MVDEPMLFRSRRTTLIVGVVILIFGIVTRNIVVIILAPVNFLVLIPSTLKGRVLLLSSYCTLAALALFVLAWVRGTLSGPVSLVIGMFAVFALFGWIGLAYRRRHPIDK